MDKDIRYCTYCPKLCRAFCPVATAKASETLTPWGKMNHLYLLEKRWRRLDLQTAEIFYACLGCLACRTYCEHQITPPESLWEGRRKAVLHNLLPPRMEELLTNYQENLNLQLAEIVQQLVPDELLEPDAKAVYFSGCMALRHYPEMVKNTSAIFKALGLDYIAVYSHKLQCCGLPLHHAGLWDQCRKYMQRVSKILSSCKLIISGCPACTYTLKSIFPRHGARISAQIVHFSEFISQIEGISQKLETPPTPVTKRCFYHDPCYLGRYLGVYQPPRQILSSLGLEVLDFPSHHESSHCCGGGGLVPENFPEIAQSVSAARLVELREPGGAQKVEQDLTPIVTSCPSCLHHLSGVEEKRKLFSLEELVIDGLRS